MPKRCEKYRFRSELSAKLAMLRIRRAGNQTAEHHVRRAYLCPNCLGWHLTSQPLQGHADA